MTRSSALDNCSASSGLMKPGEGRSRRTPEGCAAASTSSLDPSARHVLWDAIRTLVRNGTTVLLTTHDLDEADQLADSIAIIDRGRIVANGSARDLKAQVGRTRFVVTAPSSEAL